MIWTDNLHLQRELKNTEWLLENTVEALLRIIFASTLKERSPPSACKPQSKFFNAKFILILFLDNFLYGQTGFKSLALKPVPLSPNQEKNLDNFNNRKQTNENTG